MFRFTIAACVLAAAPLCAQVGFDGDDFDPVAEALKLCDTNKDKKITAAEAREARKTYFKDWKALDAITGEDDRDQKSWDVEEKWSELMPVLTPREFAELDQNADRILTTTELRALEGDVVDMDKPGKVHKAPEPRKLGKKDHEWITEQEWLIALDVFDADGNKKLGAEELRAIVKLGLGESHSMLLESVYFLTDVLMGTLEHWLGDFEMALLAEKDGEEPGKDLSGVIVTGKDFEKQAEAYRKKSAEDAARAEKLKNDPEYQKKQAEEAEARKKELEKRKAEKSQKQD